MKNHQFRAELFYKDGKDGQTDLRDEANSRFYQFLRKRLQPYVIIGHNISLMGSVKVHMGKLFQN